MEVLESWQGGAGIRAPGWAGGIPGVGGRLSGLRPVYRRMPISTEFFAKHIPTPLNLSLISALKSFSQTALNITRRQHQ